MKNRKLFSLFILLVFSAIYFSCSDDDPLVDPSDPNDEMMQDTVIFDPDLLKINFPKRHVMFDTTLNLAFIGGRGVGMENLLISHNYVTQETKRYTSSSEDIGINGFSIGQKDGLPEIYIRSGKKLYIMDAINLVIIDSLEFPYGLERVEFHEPNLFFVGTCGSTDSGPKVYNRDSKEFISESFNGGNCERITTYREPGSNDITVFSFSYGSSDWPVIVKDKFDQTGQHLESQLVIDFDGYTNHNFLETVPECNYIMSDFKGNLIHKDDLSYIGTVGDSAFENYLIADGGNFIYTLRSKLIEKYTYPSLELIDSRRGDEEAFDLIIDEGKIFRINIIKMYDDLDYNSRMQFEEVELF